MPAKEKAQERALPWVPGEKKKRGENSGKRRGSEAVLSSLVPSKKKGRHTNRTSSEKGGETRERERVQKPRCYPTAANWR